MANKALPEQSVLLQLLRYEPETGKLFWRERGVEWFPGGRRTPESDARWWNRRFAGKEAFTAKEKSGYHSGGIFGVIQKAHRVAWVMTNGPIEGEIDHINGVKCDNRLCNLRDVSRQVNMQNKAKNSNNASGTTGVFWHNATQSWVAKIKDSHLGCFQGKDDAIAARRAAEAKQGFHPNHGRAA